MAVSTPTSALRRPRHPALTDAALTMLAPVTWGTTYVVTSELLPPDRPLLAGALRALPAGLLLLAVTRRAPTGWQWGRLALLGLLNFGAFFPLLFYGAYHLPGGVAATVGSVQPVVVMALSAALLRTRPTWRSTALGATGVTGVAMMVLTGDAAFDAVGVAAQLLAASCMALGIVLDKRWGRPEGLSVLAATGWKMVLGGGVLVPVTLVAEGTPPALSAVNAAGYAYIGLVGTALAYVLWFRGIERLAPTQVSFLGLSNPLTATLLGLLLLGQTLTPWQALGLLVALGSLLASQMPSSAAARGATSR